MACRVLDWQRTPDSAAPAAAREVPAPQPLLRPSALEVNVTTEDGHPLSDARVEASIAGVEQNVPHEHLQRYVLTGIRASGLSLRVSAERLGTFSRSVTLEPGKTLVVDVRLAPADKTGQIRGLIRSFDGKGLSASVRIEPLGVALQTDAGGVFSVDVPPGRYAVVVVAPGHGAQTRSVEVGPDGVVILNADLRRAP